MVRIRSVGALVALSLTLACGGRGSEGGAEEDVLVLRGYAAPGQAQQVADVLNQLMTIGVGDNRHSVGKARVAPGEQVLVLAPSSVHEGLGKVVRAQLGREADAAPTQIATTYWFVAGRPAAGPAERGGELDEVKTALDEIDGVQGQQEYRLIERVGLRQAEGSTSRAHASRLQISQKAVSVSDGNIVADVDVTFWANSPYRASISSVLNLQAGQFLVLGQLALNSDLDPFERPHIAQSRGGGLAVRARPAETALYMIMQVETDPHS